MRDNCYARGVSVESLSDVTSMGFDGTESSLNLQGSSTGADLGVVDPKCRIVNPGQIRSLTKRRLRFKSRILQLLLRLLFQWLKSLNLDRLM